MYILINVLKLASNYSLSRFTSTTMYSPSDFKLAMLQDISFSLTTFWTTGTPMPQIIGVRFAENGNKMTCPALCSTLPFFSYMNDREYFAIHGILIEIWKFETKFRRIFQGLGWASIYNLKPCVFCPSARKKKLIFRRRGIWTKLYGDFLRKSAGSIFIEKTH